MAAAAFVRDNRVHPASRSRMKHSPAVRSAHAPACAGAPFTPPLLPQSTNGGQTYAADWSYAVRRDHNPAIAAPWQAQRGLHRPMPAANVPLAMHATNGGQTYAADWSYAVRRDHSSAVAAPWVAQRAARNRPAPADMPLAMHATCGATHAADWSYAAARDFDAAVAAPWAARRSQRPAKPAASRPVVGAAVPLEMHATCGGTYAGDWSYAVNRDFDPAVAAPWAVQRDAKQQRKPAAAPAMQAAPVPAL